MPTNRLQQRGGMREVSGRRGGVVASLLVAFVALSLFLTACDDQPSTFVVDDFESGALTDWQAVGIGSGGWFVYTDGGKAPDPARTDPNVPFVMPDPPQGK